MWRMPVGFVGGGLAWWLIGSAGVWVMVNSWPEYAALTRQPESFTTAMHLARLLIGMLASAGAGLAIAVIVRRRTWTPWLLSAVLLAALGAVEILSWSRFPVWYHLLFLATLPPILITSERFLTDRLVIRFARDRSELVNESAREP